MDFCEIPFTEMGFLIDPGSSWKPSLCLGKALASLAVVLQEGTVLTWSHCSISLEKVVQEEKAQFRFCCWGTHLLQDGARYQQAVTSSATEAKSARDV